MRDGVCPICDAEVPMHGDERMGDTVYCTYCEVPLRFVRMTAEDQPKLVEEEDA